MDLKGKTGSVLPSISTLNGSNIFMLKSETMRQGIGKLLCVTGVGRTSTMVQIQMWFNLEEKNKFNSVKIFYSRNHMYKD